ncbi:type IV pilin protein [Synechococcus sp. MIT S1220]|uniref:type IV pilin protein n=1 Tax=Synechococcus sp. MIT S1220 TaxID=3082549 RepID=UPI0039AEB59F
MLKTPKSCQGFTLTEVLITTLIVGILASIALPSYFRQFQTTCQAEVVSKLSLLASSASAYKDIYGTAPLNWEDLSNMNAVMTTTGPADADDGPLTTEITIPSCDYAISRSSEKTGEKFIFNAVPTPNTGEKAAFNVVSCFDLSNGASDLKRGNKDVEGVAENGNLTCWK